MGQHNKTRLLEIRQQTKLTSQDLAKAAGVSLGEAYAVEIGGFVSQEVAQKVVAAFARLSGRPLTLQEIVINTSVKGSLLKGGQYEEC